MNWIVAAFLCAIAFDAIAMEISISRIADALQRPAPAGMAVGSRGATASVDPTGVTLTKDAFAIHVFFSDRAGSLYCVGARSAQDETTVIATCEMTPEGAVRETQ